MGVLLVIGRFLAGYLIGPSRAPYANAPTDETALARTVRPGDILLVDGKQRISTAIKYLTQSTWSHAALCVEATGDASGEPPRFVEADSLRNLALNASIFVVLAVGQTLVLVTRNVDLSVGSVLGLSAYLAGDLLSRADALPIRPMPRMPIVCPASRRIGVSAR